MNIFSGPDWAKNAVIYEVNLRQYTVEGNFISFRKHLHRLSGMGIDAIWFMPLTPISAQHRKGTLGSYYACSSYRAINKEFGTCDEFKSLVNDIHSMGMKVIIDWVANHTGWDHPWTKTNPQYYKSYRKESRFYSPEGMLDVIELDYSNSEVQQAMIAEMKWWIDEFDIDGFRCDLASWVPSAFWNLANKMLGTKKKLFWLAEADLLESPAYRNAFDAFYSWNWMHQTQSVYQHHSDINDLLSLLKKYASATNNEKLMMWFTSNHDENSWNGTEFEKYGSLWEPLTVFNFTWDGIPMMYSGQEIPNMRRLSFFEKDTLDWSNITLEPFYKNLIQIRKHPALRGAEYEVRTELIDVAQGVIAFRRSSQQHSAMMVLNFSDTSVAIQYVLHHLSNEVLVLSDSKSANGWLARYGYLLYLST